MPAESQVRCQHTDQDGRQAASASGPRDACGAPPLAFGSHKSKLIAVLRGAPHAKRVTLDRNEWLRLVTWIDANAHHSRHGFVTYSRADEKGLAVTLRAKTARNAKMERLVGAADFKLWTCLHRRMNEESTAEESVTVRWTFDEAAQIAERWVAETRVARDRVRFALPPRNWSPLGIKRLPSAAMSPTRLKWLP